MKLRKQDALRQLLAKEARLIQAIDRLRARARRDGEAEGALASLGALAEPREWRLGAGDVSVHTPATARAAALRSLYAGMAAADATVDERLDLLLHVRWAVEDAGLAGSRGAGAGGGVSGAPPRPGAGLGSWSAAAAAAASSKAPPAAAGLGACASPAAAGDLLVRLLDREADLLRRGRDPLTMDGLRRRSAALFLELCQSPCFSPAAAAGAAARAGAALQEEPEWLRRRRRHAAT